MERLLRFDPSTGHILRAYSNEEMLLGMKELLEKQKAELETFVEDKVEEALSDYNATMEKHVEDELNNLDAVTQDELNTAVEELESTMNNFTETDDLGQAIAEELENNEHLLETVLGRALKLGQEGLLTLQEQLTRDRMRHEELVGELREHLSATVHKRSREEEEHLRQCITAQLGKALNQVEEIENLKFWGRIRWLLTGKVSR